MARDRGVQTERLVATVQTTTNVYFALAKAGITGELAVNAVTEILNAGIFFRERDDDAN